jgi:mannose-6-phosphate isomerase
MNPLVFEPYLRPMVWGGRRLESLVGKGLPAEGAFGESWEISGHPLHVSRVAEGPLRGVTLAELCSKHGRELFGDAPADLSRFPLLIKFLDCHEHLSVQVHPTDELAARLALRESGKTEAWVILEADANARIYAGLLRGTTRADVERAVAAGTVTSCLHSFTPKPGDCVFLPAGTVHAVGGGVLMAEVQQTSDATFRLFDWNRLGTDGKPRALHIRESLQAIDWSAGPVNPVIPTALAGLPANVRGEGLVRCRYFELNRFEIGETLSAAPGRLSIWIVVAGEVDLEFASYRRRCRRGETVLVPATAQVRWHAATRQPRPTLLQVQLTA